jgi:hypothetical protein
MRRRVFEPYAPCRFRDGEALVIEMIRATVLVKDPGTLTASRYAGEFDFAQLPSPGDHVQITNERGKTSLGQLVSTLLRRFKKPGSAIANHSHSRVAAIERPERRHHGPQAVSHGAFCAG